MKSTQKTKYRFKYINSKFKRPSTRLTVIPQMSQNSQPEEPSSQLQNIFMLDKSQKNDGPYPDVFYMSNSSNDVQKHSSESKKKELSENSKSGIFRPNQSYFSADQPQKQPTLRFPSNNIFQSNLVQHCGRNQNQINSNFGDEKVEFFSPNIGQINSRQNTQSKQHHSNNNNRQRDPELDKLMNYFQQNKKSKKKQQENKLRFNFYSGWQSHQQPYQDRFDQSSRHEFLMSEIIQLHRQNAILKQKLSVQKEKLQIERNQNQKKSKIIEKLTTKSPRKNVTNEDIQQMKSLYRKYKSVTMVQKESKFTRKTIYKYIKEQIDLIKRQESKKSQEDVVIEKMNNQPE